MWRWPLDAGLSRRLLIWFLAISAMLLLVAVLVSMLRSDGRDSLDKLSEQIGTEVVAAYRNGGRGAVNQLHQVYRDRMHINVYLEHHGEMLVDFPMPPPLTQSLPELGSSVLKRNLAGDDRMLAMPLTIDGDATYHLMLFQSGQIAANVDSRSSVALMVAVQVGLTLLAIVVMGLLLAHNLNRPIAATDEVVRRIAEGDLHARVDASISARADDFGRLARGVNEMGGRIAGLMDDRDRLLHHASHELRSPLARLRILVELARIGSADEVEGRLAKADKEIDRMEHLVDEIMSDARIQRAPSEIRLRKVELSEVVRRAVASAAVEAQAHGVGLRTEVPAPVSIDGDAELLTRALDNLLRNAIRFSTPGDAIDVGLHRDAGAVVLTVADCGPGVPEEELERIFQPFFRIPGEERGKGYGLGMALVQRIAQAHGASLRAYNRAPRGLMVMLRLKAVETA